MKKLFFIVFVTIMFSITAKSQIKMSSNGYVGLGYLGASNPNYQLDVRGKGYYSCQPAASGIYFTTYYNQDGGVWYTDPILQPQWASSFWLGNSTYPYWKVYSWKIYSFDGTVQTYSDIKLKSNIRALGSTLDKIKRLNPVKYDLNLPLDKNLPKERAELIKTKGKDNVGFIAQEVQEIFPEVVDKDSDSQLLTIDYACMVPFLVEAIKEQQIIIENLQFELNELKMSSSNNNNLKNSSNSAVPTDVQTTSTNTLYQNSPNPFSQSTKIEYFLSEDVQNAMINVYNMNGTQLKCVPLHQKGYGNILLNGNEFSAGLYMYSLIVDGNEIDTKRMILTNL